MAEHYPGETINDHEEFTAVLAEAIARIPEPKPTVDPYHHHSPHTTRIRTSDCETSYPDGRIDYSPTSDVRRVMISNIELVYVLDNGPRQRNRFVINTFKLDRGLESRTTFLINTKGQVQKSYETPPWNILSSGPTYHHEVLPEDKASLYAAMKDPESHFFNIQAMATPNAEETQALELSADEIRRSNEQYRQDMQELLEAERAAWEFLHTTPDVYGD